MVVESFTTASIKTSSVIFLNGIQKDHDIGCVAKMVSFKDDPPCIVGMGIVPYVSLTDPLHSIADYG